MLELPVMTYVMFMCFATLDECEHVGMTKSATQATCEQMMKVTAKAYNFHNRDDGKRVILACFEAQGATRHAI